MSRLDPVHPCLFHCAAGIPAKRLALANEWRDSHPTYDSNKIVLPDIARTLELFYKYKLH